MRSLWLQYYTVKSSLVSVCLHRYPQVQYLSTHWAGNHLQIYAGAHNLQITLNFLVHGTIYIYLFIYLYAQDTSILKAIATTGMFS